MLRNINPKVIKAAELVNLLANSGPASDIRVRVHFSDGSSAVGHVRWRDDRVNGPAVVIDDDKSSYNGGIIPLGGVTVYYYPPKISSMSSARATPSPLGGKVTVQKTPIDSHASKFSFEIIDKE